MEPDGRAARRFREPSHGRPARRRPDGQPRAGNRALLQVGKNRFTALRRFQILACNAAERNCSAPNTGFQSIYTSPANAFFGFNPRPVAPEMILREFAVPRTRATHIQVRVLANQCTGNEAFQGEQDADPANATDCRTGAPGAGPVPVFGDLPQVLAPRDG